ncbi:MAG: NAD(P)(+) transhydrogenase (Re/Si-specific) subunit beta [Saprospiraceae bacterium]
MLNTIIEIGYFIGVILFIIGLRKLSSPDSARTGNLYAAAGMGLGIIASMLAPLGDVPNNYAWIFGGMIVGSGIGAFASKKVALTDMPQLVSLFNGFGGACAVLIASVELNNGFFGESEMTSTQLGTILFALFVGAVAFTGSLLAWAKLDGRVKDKSLKLPAPTFINNGLLIVIVGLIAYLVGFDVNVDDAFKLSMLILGLSLLYGFTFVIPIGGADMPVVISLLNSFTGLTAAAAGLIYGNQIMLVGGILVGASGTILTILMCNAMNRSLWNVIFGSFGGGETAAAKGVDGDVKEIGLQDLAIQLFYSKSVMFVPGYGLAVAQAQKACKELDDLLEANGVEVRYAIHPVAGRMPGHMNVLLAEADVPYPKLLDLEEANDALPNVDVVIVVGANDVVNPSANDDPGSPIYGMPIINVTDAKHTVVMKRSMSFGYAGIQNPLFFHDKNKMLFGDAKKSLQALVSEVKDLG